MHARNSSRVISATSLPFTQTSSSSAWSFWASAQDPGTMWWMTIFSGGKVRKATPSDSTPSPTVKSNLTESAKCPLVSSEFCAALKHMVLASSEAMLKHMVLGEDAVPAEPTDSDAATTLAHSETSLEKSRLNGLFWMRARNSSRVISATSLPFMQTSSSSAWSFWASAQDPDTMWWMTIFPGGKERKATPSDSTPPPTVRSNLTEFAKFPLVSSEFCAATRAEDPRGLSCSRMLSDAMATALGNKESPASGIVCSTIVSWISWPMTLSTT